MLPVRMIDLFMISDFNIAVTTKIVILRNLI